MAPGAEHCPVESTNSTPLTSRVASLLRPHGLLACLPSYISYSFLLIHNLALGQEPARGDEAVGNPPCHNFAAGLPSTPLLSAPSSAMMPVASLRYGVAGPSFSAGGAVAGATGSEWDGLGHDSGANGLFMDRTRAQVVAGGPTYLHPRLMTSTVGLSSASAFAGLRGSQPSAAAAATSSGSSFDARFPPTLSGTPTSMDTESMLRRPSPPMNNLVFQPIGGRPPRGASSGPPSGTAAPPARPFTPPPSRAVPQLQSPVECAEQLNLSAALRPSAAGRSRAPSPKRRSPAAGRGGGVGASARQPITTVEALGFALLSGFKTIDMKMAKMQTTVDHVSSLVSSEMAKSNNFAVLAEKMTAAQSTTTSVVAELVAAREAAAAAVLTAPASTLSEKEITDEQHAQDRVAAKAIKVSCACFLFVRFVVVPLALRATSKGAAVYGGSLTLALNVLEFLFRSCTFLIDAGLHLNAEALASYPPRDLFEGQVRIRRVHLEHQ